MLKAMRVNTKCCRYITYSCMLSVWIIGVANTAYSQTSTIYSQAFIDDYSETANLNFSIDNIAINLGTGKITGNFQTQYAQTGPSCFYYQLSGSDVSAGYDGGNITLPSFSTPWCQFTGIETICPVYSLPAFDINIPYVADVNNTIGFQLELSAVSGIPTFAVTWQESATVTLVPSTPSYTVNVCPPWKCKITYPGTPAETASDSYTAVFPSGNFTDFVVDNAISAANQASGCAPPS